MVRTHAGLTRRGLALGPLGLLIAGAVRPSAAQTAATPITIGYVLPYSGDLAWYGQEIGRGYDLAIRKVNVTGGINGRVIAAVKADVPSPTAALGEIGRLHEQGIKVLIGSGYTAMAVAATPIAERNGMVWWETNALDNSLTSRGLKHVFQFAPNNDTFDGVSVTLFRSLAAKLVGKPLEQITAGLVYENSVAGMSQSKVQRAGLAGLGTKIVVDISYDRKSADLSSVILQLRSAAPDILIESGYQDDIVLFWRQAKELGYLPKVVISAGAAATQDFVKALGPQTVEGIIAYSFPSPDMEERGAPGVTEFARAYRDAYGQPPPSGHSLSGYAGLIALAKVLQVAGSDDPDAVARAARATDEPWDSFPNGSGLKFTDTGRNERAAVSGFQWQGGKLVTIWPDRVANGSATGPLTPWDKR